jgi:hypothetical protein
MARINRYSVLLFLSRAAFAAAILTVIAAVLDVSYSLSAQCSDDAVVHAELQEYNPDARCGSRSSTTKR